MDQDKMKNTFVVLLDETEVDSLYNIMTITKIRSFKSEGKKLDNYFSLPVIYNHDSRSE